MSSSQFTTKQLILGPSISGFHSGLSSNATADRTISLFDANDTIVGRATSDTLTNKNITGSTNTVSTDYLKTTGSAVSVASAAPPVAGQALIATSATTASWSSVGGALVDNTTFIVDAVDSSKKIGFDAGGTTSTTTVIAAAQTANRTVTLPDATDTLVGRATTDTLTNKTLAAPIIATIVNSGTLTLPTSSDTLVGRATTDTLTNKTLAAPIIATIVNSGTLTLPTTTDTLVGRATTDTLTNKTITGSTNTVDANALRTTGSSVTVSSAAPPTAGQSLVATSATTAAWSTVSSTLVDTSTFIVDSVDATKRIGFDAAGTTGTTTTLLSSQTSNRTLTLPDVTDTLVTRTTTDTLTNKTLTAPVISSIINSGTLTLPTSTDTLVGRATTDTLTNKTLTAPVIATIVNSGTLTLPTSTDTLVGRTTTDTLANKTLTAPVISSIVNSGTLTLPTSTDTLVGRATTDTLTNKNITGSTNTVDANALKTTGASVNVSSAAPPTTGQALIATSATTATWGTIGSALVDTTTFIVDSVDATKKIGFDAAGTTGTTSTIQSSQTTNRTLTLPDITDTIVTRTNTETLTNKTLTAPIIATIVNSGTLTLPTSTDTLIARATTDTLTNKTLTAPIIATIVNSGTLTLPTSTDTLVARATTDTLTNKTITGSTNTVDANALKTTGASVNVASAAPPTIGQILKATSATTATWQNEGSLIDTQTFIVDSVDATKRIGFDSAGTTSTTTTIQSSQTTNRTLTLPDITDTIVTRTNTETLTNKTLTAPVISSIVNTGTLTLPTSTDTLVGRATTDTMTNKTLTGATNTIEATGLRTASGAVSVSAATAPTTGQALVATSGTTATWQTLSATGGNLVDNTTFIVDATDATKRIGFDAAGTTSTTLTLQSAQTVNRTLTFPDATDTLVGKATTDTFTNKTITGGSGGNTVSANQLYGTAVSSTAPTYGQMLQYDGSNWAPSTHNVVSATLRDGNCSLGDILLLGNNNGTYGLYGSYVQPRTNWANSAQSTASGASNFNYAICTDIFGNSYYTGFFAGTATFGSISITAVGTSNIFVAKSDPNGNWLWANKYSGTTPNSNGVDIACDTSGNVYVMGWFGSGGNIVIGATTLTSLGGNALMYFKLATNGTAIWAARTSIAAGINIQQPDDWSMAITVDSSGNPIISASTDTGITVSGVSGSYSVTGTASPAVLVFVVKLSTAGAFTWGATLNPSGTTGRAYVYKMCTDSAQNVYVGGHTKTTTVTVGTVTIPAPSGFDDGYVLKINSAGTAQWALTILNGSAGSNWVYGLAADNVNSIYVVGRVTSSTSLTFGSVTLSGTPLGFIAKINSASAAWSWANAMPGKGYGVCCDNNYCYASGDSQGITSIGGIPLVSTGLRDSFCGQLTSAGAWVNALTMQSDGTYPWGISTDGNGNTTCLVEKALTAVLNGVSTSFPANTFLNGWNVDWNSNGNFMIVAALQAGTNGNSVYVTTHGLVTGYSGLTSNTRYYYNLFNKTPTTTATNYTIGYSQGTTAMLFNPTPTYY